MAGRWMRLAGTAMARARAERLSVAVIAFGCLNVALYAGLMPLWDGFDEPFHYGYVQYIERHHAAPVAGRTALSAEIGRSLALAPASYLVKRNIPAVITFEEYFRLSSAARHALRQQLDHLEPSAAESGGGDYEALQAPLAYLVLAPIDLAMKGVRLTRRILVLRLFGGLFSVLATAFLTLRLGRQVGLSRVARSCVVFLLFSCQMFYGSVAHVSNDWLAVPLFVLVLTASISLYVRPSRSSVLVLAASLAAGLLTKGYFLSAVPFACGLVLVLCLKHRLRPMEAALFAGVCGGLAGPWYFRNLTLYGNLSGMQESSGGVSVRQLFDAALGLPWARCLTTAAKIALWSGNNSQTVFNAATIHLVIVMAILAALLFGHLMFTRRPTAAEGVVLAGVLSYLAGLAYAAVLTFLYTHGTGVAPAPWYVQPLFPPCLTLLLVGLSSAGLPGRVVRAVTLWVWAYVISATYLVKLIPFYGGLGAGGAHLSTLWSLYTAINELCDHIGTVSLAPPVVLLLMSFGVVSSAAWLATTLSLAE